MYRQAGRLIFNRMPCCCHPGASTKTFVIWLEFYTCDISTHGFSTPCLFYRLCVFLFVTAQIRTCCVCSANMACWDVHMARPRPPGKELTRDVRGHPDVREDKVKSQPLTNWQPPWRGLAVSTSGREITKGGVMQWTCRRSPSRYIALPGSLPEYLRPSL